LYYEIIDFGIVQLFYGSIIVWCLHSVEPVYNCSIRDSKCGNLHYSRFSKSAELGPLWTFLTFQYKMYCVRVLSLLNIYSWTSTPRNRTSRYSGSFEVILKSQSSTFHSTIIAHSRLVFTKRVKTCQRLIIDERVTVSLISICI